MTTMALSRGQSVGLQVVRETGRTGDGFLCNLRPSLHPTSATDERILDAGAVTGLLPSGRLPAAVDLREPWWKVATQGRTGSGIGWAAADGVGRYTMVQAGRLASTKRLSARFVWMASKERGDGDLRPTSFVEASGTSLRAAVHVATTYGFALEAEVPFHTRTTMYTGDADELFGSCAGRRVDAVDLGRRPAMWRSWLTHYGPILAGVWVDRHWDAYDGFGVLDGFDPTSTFGGHAVCIVGYREDGTFIVRNSWGTSWGDQGFGYVTSDYVDAAFFPESYGMVAA